MKTILKRFISGLRTDPLIPALGACLTKEPHEVGFYLYLYKYTFYIKYMYSNV